MYKVLLIVLALSALLLSGCAGGNTDRSGAESSSAASSGTEADPVTIHFEATDLEGNAVSSDVFAQSRLTMLNVWATYCNPCLSEMSDLGELAADYDGADFQLIGIVSDVLEGEDQSQVERLVQETGADYPHLLLNQSLYDALLSGVSAVPTTFFLDTDGTPLGYVLGARDKDAWKEIIDGLLEEL